MTAARKTLLLAALGALALPTASEAATLDVGNGGVYTYTAGAGKANNLQASFYSFTVSLYETAGDPITLTGPQAGSCTSYDSGSTSSVSCSLPPSSATVNLGPQADEDVADRAQVGGDVAALTTNGGGGNDVLFGSGVVNGGAGDDRLDAYNAQGVVLNGDAGDDKFKGGDHDDAFNGGDGSDTADYSAYNGVASYSLDGIRNDGAAGQDNIGTDVENITAGSQSDTLVGDEDANVLDGGGGDDVVEGRGGDDTFLGGRGADGSDTITGGEGRDAMSYADRVDDVRVRLDGQPNDGGGGERDNVGADIENVFGGFGDDFVAGQVGPVLNFITGGPGDDGLHGGAGNDVLWGNPGRDSIDGDAGLDDILGEEGDDDVDGGLGNDTISGGDGFDLLDGGAGADDIAGNSGGDVLRLRDGVADTATCGAGVDTVDADDAGDAVNGDCEHVDGPVAQAAANVAPVIAFAPIAPAAPVAPGAKRSSRRAGAVACTVRGRKLSCRVGRHGRGLTARLSRGGRVYARGRVVARAARLKPVRRTRAGRYELVLRAPSGRKVLVLDVAVR